MASVEGELRLHAHAASQPAAAAGNAAADARPLLSVRPLLRMQALRLPTRALSIRCAPFPCPPRLYILVGHEDCRFP